MCSHMPLTELCDQEIDKQYPKTHTSRSLIAGGTVVSGFGVVEVGASPGTSTRIGASPVAAPAGNGGVVPQYSSAAASTGGMVMVRHPQ